MASASSPSTPALWDECRQPSALTAGRLGDGQPVSFYSDETGVAIVAECCMPQVMPTSRSGFAERLTRQRMDRRANRSRTAGAATVDGRVDAVACTRLGFATVPRLAIPQRGQGMEGLGAAFCYGLDGRAMSWGQLAVACRAGGPW
jgi:hypothetical protein